MNGQKCKIRKKFKLLNFYKMTTSRNAITEYNNKKILEFYRINKNVYKSTFVIVKNNRCLQ